MIKSFNPLRTLLDGSSSNLKVFLRSRDKLIYGGYGPKNAKEKIGRRTDHQPNQTFTEAKKRSQRTVLSLF